MADREYGARLTADPSNFVAGAEASRKAQKNLNEELGRGAAQAKTAASEAQRYVDGLKREADTIGKTKTEVERYRASQHQLTDAQRAQVQQSLRQIQAYETKQRVLSTLRTAAAALGITFAALTATAVAGIKGTIDTADSYNRLHQSLGLSVQALSAYRFAAQVARISDEQFATGIKTLAQNVSEAQSGVGDGAALFHVLGAELEAAAKRGESLERILPLLAERFSQFAEGPNKTALAMALFGETGEKLIPVLNRGAAGIAELRAEAQSMGIVMSDDFARRATEFNENWARLTANLDALKIVLSGGLIDDLNRLVETFLKGSQAQGAGGGVWALVKDFVGRSSLGSLASVPGVGPLLVTARLSGLGVNEARGEDELAALRSAMGGFASYRGGGEAAPALPKTGTPQVSDYQRLVAQVTTLNTALASQLATGEQLTQADQMRVQIMAALEQGTLKLNSAQQAELHVKLDQAKATELHIRALAQEEQVARLGYRLWLERTKAEEAHMNAIRDSDFAFKDRLDAMRLETSLMFATEAEREKAIEFKKIDLEIDRLKVDASHEVVEALEREREARKQAIGVAIDVKQAAKASKDASDAAAREWQASFDRTADNIERSLTDAIMRGGKNGRELLEAALRTAVLTPIISPIVRPVAMATSGIVHGLMGPVFGGGPAPGVGAPGYFGGTYGAGGFGGFGFGGIASMANGVFQSAGLATGSQFIADIGNLGYGTPILGGLLTYAATGSPEAGLFSAGLGAAGTLIGGPVGGAIGTALGGILGSSLFGGGQGRHMRTAGYSQALGGAGGVRSPSGHFFHGEGIPAALDAFEAQIAARERNLIRNLGLSGAEIAAVNSALGGLSSKRYSFGTEHTDITQSGAFQEIAADRLRVISQTLGTSIEELTSIMSMSAEQWQQAIANLEAAQDQATAQLAGMVRGLKGQLGISTLEQFQSSLALADDQAPLARLASARSIYDAAIARAKAGDLSAIAEATSAASSYLGIGRDVYASGGSFQAIRAEIVGSIESLKAQQLSIQADILKDLPAAVMQASLDQVGEFKRGFGAMVQELQDVKKELKLFRSAT